MDITYQVDSTADAPMALPHVVQTGNIDQHPAHVSSADDPTESTLTKEPTPPKGQWEIHGLSTPANEAVPPQEKNTLQKGRLKHKFSETEPQQNATDLISDAQTTATPRVRRCLCPENSPGEEN